MAFQGAVVCLKEVPSLRLREVPIGTNKVQCNSRKFPLRGYEKLCVSDNKWNSLLKQANQFDWNDHKKRMKSMKKDPLYIEWYDKLPDRVIEAEEKMPFENFYTDKKTGKSVIRLYGVMDDGIHYCAVSGNWFAPDFIINGMHRDNLIKLDKWKAHHLERIRYTDTPANFLMPDGWFGMILYREHCRESNFV